MSAVNNNWAVVTFKGFEDQVDIIPTNWLYKDEETGENYGWYPSYEDSVKVNKALLKREHPDPNWLFFEICKIFGQAG